MSANDQIAHLQALVALWQAVADNELRLADALAADLVKTAPTRIAGQQSALDLWMERRGRLEQIPELL